MSKIEIRKTATKADRRIMADYSFYAFYPSPGSQEKQLRNMEYYDGAHELILYEDGKPQSTAFSIPMEQNVRGKRFSMAGIAGVATDPEARKKGFVKMLMKNHFEHMKEINQPFTCLYPFRESFYAKMGYVTFPQDRVATISISNLRDLSTFAVSGTFERGEYKKLYPQYYEFLKKMIAQTHGFAIHPIELVESRQENPHWVLMAKDGSGRTIGTLVYKISGFEGKLIVRNFLYLNAQGKYLLLNWIARHQDQVLEVTLPVLPGIQIERWANDLKSEIKTRGGVPAAMGRIAIIEELDGMAVGEGRISIEIEDEHCRWNNGIWTFYNEKGQLEVKKGEKPDCKISIQGLSAIVYGFYDLDDFPFFGWGKLDEKHKKIILTMFPPTLPSLFENF